MAKKNYINVLLISWSWIIGWLINYVYHPIMLQYLTIEQFWEFWSLVWIFNLLWVLIVWLGLFLNKEISANLENKEKIKYIFLESFKLLWLIGLILYIIFIFCSPLIWDFLKIDDYKIIILVGLIIVLSFMWASEWATLKWLKIFGLIWFNSISWPLIKLLVWFILIYHWFSLYWAIIWFITSSIITFFISLLYILFYFRKVNKVWTTKELIKDFYKNKRQILNFFLVSSFFAVLMNIDVIIVKNIFDDKTAWIYAWIAVISKFLIFLILSIETVYYWQIMEYSKKKVPIHLIKNPLILMILVSILAIFVNYFVWWFVLKIVKEELSDYTYIYLLSLIYYSLLAFISFFVKILVWWWKYYINNILWLLTMWLFVVIYTIWNSSLESFIYSFISVWIVWVIVSWIAFFREYRNSIN